MKRLMQISRLSPQTSTTSGQVPAPTWLNSVARRGRSQGQQEPSGLGGNEPEQELGSLPEHNYLGTYLVDEDQAEVSEYEETSGAISNNIADEQITGGPKRSRSPIAKAQRPSEGQTNDGIQDRLTLLEEPPQSGVFRNRESNKLSDSTRLHSQARGASNNEPTSSSNSNNQRGQWAQSGARAAYTHLKPQNPRLQASQAELGGPRGWLRSENKNNSNDNNKSEEEWQQIFFFGAISLLFLLLLLLLLVSYMVRNRHRNRRRLAKGSLAHLLKLINPSNGSRASSGQANEASHTFQAFTQEAQNGEHIQLVDGRPTALEAATAYSTGRKSIGAQSPNGAAKRHDELIQTDSIEPLNFIKGDTDCSQLADYVANSAAGRPSRLVIMGRRLAKSSLVEAAKSAGPKVKLVTAKVRLFIDEEAEAIRARHEGVSSLWPMKFLAQLLSKRQSSEGQPKCEEGAPPGVKSEPFETTVDEGATPPAGVIRIKEPSIGAQETVAEIHYHYQAGETAGGRQADQVFSEPKQLLIAEGSPFSPDPKQQQSTSSNQLVPQTPGSETSLFLGKLSPSPLAKEAYSSVSACSLYSASPMELSQENRLTLCACGAPVYGHHHQQARGEQPLEVRDFKLGGAHLAAPETMPGRSKSQGPSPACHYGALSAIEACRPCCASVPAAGPDESDLRRPGCCRDDALFAGQLPAANELAADLKLASTRIPSLGAHYGLHEVREQQQARCASGHVAQLASERAPAKCPSHFNRHYENYYDDEQEDAYRRLTASIGIDLSLSFGHHHHHQLQQHSQSAAHQRVQAASSDGAHYATSTTDHLSELAPQLSWLRCSQRSSSYAPANTEAAEQGSLMSVEMVRLASGGRLAQAEQADQLMAGNESANYQLKSSGGSAGELLSSGSTSLGGSDSGFAPATSGHYSGVRSICRNPLCLCQSTPASCGPQPAQVQQQQQPSGPLTSVLASQAAPHQMEPIGAEPGATGTLADTRQAPPEPLNVATPIDVAERPLGQATRETIGGPLASLEWAGQASSSPNAAPSAPVKPINWRPRWRHRRRLSQRARLDSSLAGDFRFGAEVAPRRMSIAGDRLSHLATRYTRDGASLPLAGHLFHSHYQHRGSLGSEGGLLLGQAWPGVPGPGAGGSQMWRERLIGGAVEPLPPGAQVSWQRPSEGSLYEAAAQCYVATGRGLYGDGSSGGSSSGIGVSGSACTNTPTGILATCGSFVYGTKADLANPDLAQRDQASELEATQGSQFGHLADQAADAPHLVGLSYGAQLRLAGYTRTNQAINCRSSGVWEQSMVRCLPGRKYSLPVQLESGQVSACAAGPAASLARPLFSRDQQESSFNMTPPEKGTPTYLSPPNRVSGGLSFGEHARQPISYASQTANLEAGQQQEHSRPSAAPRLSDSRRSSQTITRQSSFWLEDDSVDSILSLATASGVGEHESQADFSRELQGTETADALTIGQQLCHQGDNASQLGDNDDVDVPSRSSSPLLHSNFSDSATKATPPSEKASQARGQQNESPLSVDPSCQPLSTYKTAKSNRPEGLSAGAGRKAGSPVQRRGNLLRGVNQPKNRTSSSSTSSTTPSPSPDSSRPSERILALAPKSSSISKRHLLGKLRTRRHQRFIAGSSNSNPDRSGRSSTSWRQPNSAPSRPTSDSQHGNQEKNNATLSVKDSQSRSKALDSLGKGDGEKTNLRDSNTLDEDSDFSHLYTPSERPVSNWNSESLERQCRELWQLRAALHDDSCVGDNWSNYHQRLNRRYDSGYKSIENQLSSSLEGNVLVPAANLPAPSESPAREAVADQILNESYNERQSPALSRPPSHCSALIAHANLSPPARYESDQVASELPALEQERKSTAGEAPDSQSSPESPFNTLQSKLAELNFYDLTLEELSHDLADNRECNSRSSKSSDEDEKKKEGE